MTDQAFILPFQIFRQREKFEVVPKTSHDEWILKIKNVQESDVGGYICQLNSNPVITKTAYLNLKSELVKILLEEKTSY